MEIGLIGLGRMGGNMVERLLRGGHRVVVYDRSAEVVGQIAGKGAEGAASLNGRARMVGLAFMGAQLAWLGRRRRWRHVHVHSCANSAHIAMFAALNCRSCSAA